MNFFHDIQKNYLVGNEVRPNYKDKIFNAVCGKYATVYWKLQLFLKFIPVVHSPLYPLCCNN
jgi:hypothetical protein